MNQDKNFKVSKCEKYFKTHIIKFKPGNVTVKTWMSTMQLHQDRASTEKYMKLILDMEKEVSKKFKNRKVSHDPLKAVIHSLRIVASWADDFDIRHNLPIDEQAELVANWFCNAYDKAKENCESILSDLKEKPVAYIHNYREHDKYNIDNKLFELGMDELDEYYKEDPLEVVQEKANEMLELLIKQNKENKLNK
jgi:hypothetical protein